MKQKAAKNIEQKVRQMKIPFLSSEKEKNGCTKKNQKMIAVHSPIQNISAQSINGKFGNPR